MLKNLKKKLKMRFLTLVLFYLTENVIRYGTLANRKRGWGINTTESIKHSGFDQYGIVSLRVA